MELAGSSIWAHNPLITLDHLKREALRKQKLAILLTGIFKANRRIALAISLEPHGQHQMLVTQLFLKDNA